MEYGQAQHRDVVWTNHALRRIRETGGSVEFMLKTLQEANLYHMSNGTNKYKQKKYKDKQKTTIYFMHPIYKTLFTCNAGTKLTVVTVTQK